jgi:hypothetical protein
MIRVMVFNSTFKTTSIISWWSAEYAEKTTELPQDMGKLYHIMLS